MSLQALITVSVLPCELHSNVFLLGKKICIYVFGKKEMPIMSTICYLGPRFSEFSTSNDTHTDAHKIYDLTFDNF